MHLAPVKSLNKNIFPQDHREATCNAVKQNKTKAFPALSHHKSCNTQKNIPFPHSIQNKYKTNGFYSHPQTMSILHIYMYLFSLMQTPTPLNLSNIYFWGELQSQ